MPAAGPVVARQSDLRLGRATASAKRFALLQNAPEPKLAIPSASERKPASREAVAVDKVNVEDERNRLVYETT